MNLSKSDLIHSLAQTTGLSKARAKKGLDALVAAIVEAVAAGGRAHLTDLGAFTAAKRKPRQGRNPRTGESLLIPKRSVPKFTAAQSFLDRLNPEAIQTLRTVEKQVRPIKRPARPSVKPIPIQSGD